MPPSKDAASNPPIDETKDQAAPKKNKIRELAKATRNGKTVRVLTDDVRVWKETQE